MEEFYLLTFKNTYDAMNCEKILKENAYNPIVMPTPTRITKSCGLSIRVEINYFKNVEILIFNKKINVKNIYIYKNRELKEVQS